MKSRTASFRKPNSARLVPALYRSLAVVTICMTAAFAQGTPATPAARRASPPAKVAGQAASVQAAAGPSHDAPLKDQAASEQMNARSQMEDSIERQKQSIRKQTGTASTDTFFSVAWTSAPMVAPTPMPDCPPLADSESEPMITAAATIQKLDPALIRAVIRQESGFRPCAVSSQGAMGLMQLMPETAEHFNLTDPFNAKENVRAGAEFLKQLMDRFKGDLKLTLAAYNAGPARVDGNPPSVPNIPETQDYVNQILKSLEGTSAAANGMAK